MKVILVDATTYDKDIDPRLRDLKRRYFKIKNIVRYTRLGEHIPPKQKTYAMGLLRIATILFYNGYDVKYIEFKKLDEYLQTLGDPPDIIAFSAVCPTVPMCSEAVDQYRLLFPKTRFVLGGAQLNVAPITTQKLFGNFDVYAVGFDVSVAEQIVGEKLQPIERPYAEFALLPDKISEYAINTFSTLGCPFTCNYCQDRLIPYCPVYDDGNISFFQKHLPPHTCVHFFDSVLGGGNVKRIETICDKISKTGHEFILSCDFRADLINEKTIKNMVKAGFKEIRLGAESADDELLLHNKRALKTNRLMNAIQMIRDNSDMYISLYSAIGFPGSTLKNINATISMFTSLLEERMIDEVKNCVFVPYPFDEQRFSEKELIIHDHDWRNYDRQSVPVYDLAELKGQDIWEMFLSMTDTINNSWIKGFSIDESILEEQPLYGEYIVDKYI